jgi:hypothetical protein
MKNLLLVLVALFLTNVHSARADDVTTIHGKILMTADNQPAFTSQWFANANFGIVNWMMDTLTVTPNNSFETADLSQAKSVALISPALPAKCIVAISGDLNRTSAALFTMQLSGTSCEALVNSLVPEMIELKIEQLPVGSGVVLPAVLLMVDKP